MTAPAEQQAKSISDVAAFWDRCPLFSGESPHPVGSLAWFEEHEAIYIGDCFAGSMPDAVFTAGIDAESAVLDVGCGPGFWVRYFARLGVKRLSACDLTERAVQLTRRSLELFGLHADVRVGDAEDLPYGDGVFDHVNCQGVIHHTPRPEHALREFHRVLRPGGTLCFSVYHRNFLLRHPRLLKVFAGTLGRFVGLRGRGRERLLASGDPDEIVRRYDGVDNPIGRAYTLEQLRAMATGLFEIRSAGYFFFPARALPIRIPRVLHRWLHRRFGLMVVARASKR